LISSCAIHVKGFICDDRNKYFLIVSTHVLYCEELEIVTAAM